MENDLKLPFGGQYYYNFAVSYDELMAYSKYSQIFVFCGVINMLIFNDALNLIVFANKVTKMFIMIYLYWLTYINLEASIFLVAVMKGLVWMI